MSILSFFRRARSYKNASTAAQALRSFATLVGDGSEATAWELPGEIGWLEDGDEGY